ncbi:MAG: nickel-dependent hydrogenase large subunit, partial [Bacteroidota bacterium]|nr:nickel-dependent hydrogenase large subunit [Bacteroidota bacterium]
APDDYREFISERVEPWSYLKFPYLKKIGWRGFVDGQESGVYHATPLSRLNAADGMATPLAQKEYTRMFETLGGKPVHATLAMHWARLIELLYASERCLELILDKEITGSELRTELSKDKFKGEGVGIVEAQRGTLTHHYWTDEKGMVTKANIIVGTTNNNAAICMSLKKAAQGLIKKGEEVSDGILNMIEMAFRAYDPCFSCATHRLPGDMPMLVNFRDQDGEIIRTLKRD